MALSWLRTAFGDDALSLPLPVKDRFRDAELLLQAMDRKINAPVTSSCGRLFDAVASILGLRHEIGFEAQAAIELEMAAMEVDLDQVLPYRLPATNAGPGPVPVAWLIREVVGDLQGETSPQIIAARFHTTLAALLAAVVSEAAGTTGITTVGLSGGVFQNRLFFEDVLERLERAGLDVLTHTLLPAGDGCIALGQAAVADVQWRLE
jgi:hydrogenase maturation protein HypF